MAPSSQELEPPQNPGRFTWLFTTTESPYPEALTSGISLASLDGKSGFRLDGVAARDSLGRSVSSAGDINGDGFDDLIVGTAGVSSNNRDFVGISYVVFGKASGFAPAIDLASLDGKNGFRLDGAETTDGGAVPVSDAGDINGDGFGDLIIGAPGAHPGGERYAGSSYVVFGKTSGFAPAIDLTSLDGKSGFRLDGEGGGDISGCSVSSAGDVNGDGFDDLIIGAPEADPNGKVWAGTSYVVFGQASGFTSAMDISSLNGKNGFRLDGVAVGYNSGNPVSSAGDVNGDGFDDLIVGAGTADSNGKYNAGSSYVVFGKASGFAPAIDLANLNGKNGFRLVGVKEGDSLGRSVSSAGDINGDGFDDLIIGAPGAGIIPENHDGKSYVLFGKASGFASIIDLASLNGLNGFSLDGVLWSDDSSGNSVSAAGDVNGDGFDDLIIGATGASLNGKYYVGSSFVVFGHASGFASYVDLGTLNGQSGFRLDGAVAYDFSGNSVSAAGDINGDGFDDLIVGASAADSNGKYSAGSSYVVFGGNFTNAVTYLGSNENDTLKGGTTAAERFVAGNGNDSMSGGGGADVFNGGAGNDTITVSDLKFQLVDGGNGSDSLALAGAGLNLNLASVRGKIENIETINLTGNGNNTLNLTALDVLNLSDSSNRLTVNGNSGDKAIGLASGWTDGGLSGGYHSYTQGQATVLVGVNVATDYLA
jgi:hypothetical protein